MNPDGSGEKQITSFTSNTQVNIHGSGWSPDSKNVIFVSNVDGFDKGAEIFTMPVDGGTRTKLTNSSRDPKTPEWR